MEKRDVEAKVVRYTDCAFAGIRKVVSVGAGLKAWGITRKDGRITIVLG